MTTALAKYVSKKILGESLQNKFGTEDPYFEQVPATRLDGRPSSKTKKRRKALPAGLSDHDGKILTKVKRRAYRLDMSLFNCCGIRFGWSSVIGIVPGIGDVIDAFMAIMVLRTCQQVDGGLPTDVKSKMMFNIVLDFAIGLVPLLGDVADALFRANTRNAVELEKYLRKKGAANLKAQGHSLPVVDPSDPDEYDRMMEEPPPGYTPGTSTKHGITRHEGKGVPGQSQSGRSPYAPPQPIRPQQAVVPDERRSGWFSGFGSKRREQDIETGDLRRRDDEILPSSPANEPRFQKNTLHKSPPGY